MDKISDLNSYPILVKQDDKQWYIDRSGKKLFEVNYAKAYKFHYGYATVKDNGLKGIIDEKHHNSLEWCGMHGSPAANFALQEADCIIGIGARFDDRTTGLVSKYAPKAFEAYENGYGGIIHVNIEKSEINNLIFLLRPKFII